MISINSERLWEREYLFKARRVGLDPCTRSQIYRIQQPKCFFVAGERSHAAALVIDKDSTPGEPGANPDG